MPPSAATGPSGARRWWGALAVGIVVVGLLGLWVVQRDRGGTPLRVRLIAADDPGASPFTSDASTTVDVDLGTVRTVGAELLGTRPPVDTGGGLPLRPLAADAEAPTYGDASAPICDVAALTEAPRTTTSVSSVSSRTARPRATCASAGSPSRRSSMRTGS